MHMLYPLLTLGCAALLVYAVRMYTAPGVGTLLAEQSQEAQPPRRPWFERFVLPLVRRLVPSYRWAIPFSDRRKIRQRLAAAGDPCQLRVNDVVQLKVASLLLSLPVGGYFGITYGLPTSATLLLIVASAAPLFFLPEIVIGELADKRQGEITTALPDLMDLLGISITAGVGFDLALQNIVARLRGPLAEELERMLHEMRLGTPRRQAYRTMIWRNESQALRGFFSALVQADELGTPVAEILEWQAQSMRHQRVQLARRKGARASSKISLVLATVLLMSLVGIIIATLALNLAFGDNSLLQLFR